MDPNEALERAAKFTAAATPENTESARARMAFVGFLYLAACGIERERDAIALSQPDEAKLRNDTLVRINAILKAGNSIPVLPGNILFSPDPILAAFAQDVAAVMRKYDGAPIPKGPDAMLVHIGDLLSKIGIMRAMLR